MNVECFNLLNNQTSGVILFGEWKEEQTHHLQQIPTFYTTCRLMNNSLCMDPWLWQYRYVSNFWGQEVDYSIYM
jgi:hypothetical protein